MRGATFKLSPDTGQEAMLVDLATARRLAVAHDPLKWSKEAELLQLNPTTGKGLPTPPTAAGIWPEWFERLYVRFPGLQDGLRHWEHKIRPNHRPHETWQQTFWRECVTAAPAWIAERSEKLARLTMDRHVRNPKGTHVRGPFPDEEPCFVCGAGRGSWKAMANGMYLGDPYSETSARGLPYVEPERFRPELAGTPAGRWGGHPG